MSNLSDEDLAELINGIDNYFVTCVTAFGVKPTELMAVLMSRMVQMAQIIGGEDVLLTLLKCAKESIVNPPDIDKPMRH